MTCPETSGIASTWAVWAQGSKDCFTVIQRVVSSSRPSEHAEEQVLGRRATKASAKTAARESPCDLYMAGGTLAGGAPRTEPQLWTQPATEKVLLTATPPGTGRAPAAAPTVSLAAQQGECERAFVVVRAGAPGQELRNLSLTFPEVPSAGTVWSYFQQGYLWANATTDLLWNPERVNTSAGWLPEPLLPIAPGAKIARVPADVPQALLVEVCVPSAAQPGNYSFEATVSGYSAACVGPGDCDGSRGAAFALRLQVRLEIWPIKLLIQQGIQTNLREANLAAALDSYVPGCYPLTDPRCATNAAWFDFMSKHRMPPSPFPSGDAVAGDAATQLRTLLAFAEAGTRLILLGDVSGCPNSNWLGGRCNFTDQLVQQKIEALRPVVGNLSAAGYGGRLAVYGFDEVMTGSPTIKEDLYAVFGAVKKAFPRIKTMSAGFGWRSTGAVPPLDAPLDIYVALFFDYCWPDVDTGQAFQSWPNCSAWRDTVRAWRSAGKEFWMYWANEPGSGPGANAHSTNGVWLNTFLQWPTIAARLLFWLGPAAVEGGVDGWYYWAENNWATGFARPIRRVNGTLYTNASNVQSTSIGDGVLFYATEDDSPAPGLRYVNIAGAPSDCSLFLFEFEMGSPEPWVVRAHRWDRRRQLVSTVRVGLHRSSEATGARRRPVDKRPRATRQHAARGCKAHNPGVTRPPEMDRAARSGF